MRSEPIGKEYSEREAREILNQCRLLRESVKRLESRARSSLRAKLRLVSPLRNGQESDAERGHTV